MYQSPLAPHLKASTAGGIDLSHDPSICRCFSGLGGVVFINVIVVLITIMMIVQAVIPAIIVMTFDIANLKSANNHRDGECLVRT